MRLKLYGGTFYKSHCPVYGEYYNEAPPVAPPVEGINHFVHIVATKYGPKSIVRVGTRISEDRIEWEAPQILNSKPGYTRWASPLDYGLYIISVPLDIVTAPIQFLGTALFTSVYYWLG